MRDSLTGAIIAAGRGDRLRSAKSELPKPLVEIGGEALLIRQIRLMLALGLPRVAVIINAETERRRQEMGLTLPEPTDLIVADTPNSMESLLRLGEIIPPGRFLLSTVDTVLGEGEFRHFFEQACRLTDSANGALGFDGALGLVAWRGDAKPLFATVEDHGKILALDDDSQQLVTASVYFFSTRIFTYAAEARAQKLDALRRYLGLMVQKRLRLVGVRMNDVIDVDEPADLDNARKMVAKRQSGGQSG